jgi:archaellum component FlaG (FlaF/FlaG flagellin family)
MTWVLLFIIALETAALIAVSAFAYRTATIILRVQDAIEESLDVLDKRYESISKIMKIPLFYDSPEIKRAVEDIGKSRDAILYVANQLTSIQEEGEENGNEKSN